MRHRKWIITALSLGVLLPFLYVVLDKSGVENGHGVLLILYVLPAQILLFVTESLELINYENNFFFTGFVKILPIFPQGYILCSLSWFLTVYGLFTVINMIKKKLFSE